MISSTQGQHITITQPALDQSMSHHNELEAQKSPLKVSAELKQRVKCQKESLYPKQSWLL